MLQHTKPSSTSEGSKNVSSNSKKSGANRRKASRIRNPCIHCRYAHARCSNQVPCSRCISLGMAEECEKAGPRRSSSSGSSSSSSSTGSPGQSNQRLPATIFHNIFQFRVDGNTTTTTTNSTTTANSTIGATTTIPRSTTTESKFIHYTFDNKSNNISVVHYDDSNNNNNDGNINDDDVDMDGDHDRGSGNDSDGSGSSDLQMDSSPDPTWHHLFPPPTSPAAMTMAMSMMMQLPPSLPPPPQQPLQVPVVQVPTAMGMQQHYPQTPSPPLYQGPLADTTTPVVPTGEMLPAMISPLGTELKGNNNNISIPANRSLVGMLPLVRTQGNRQLPQLVPITISDINNDDSISDNNNDNNTGSIISSYIADATETSQVISRVLLSGSTATFSITPEQVDELDEETKAQMTPLQQIMCHLSRHTNVFHGKRAVIVSDCLPFITRWDQNFIDAFGYKQRLENGKLTFYDFMCNPTQIGILQRYFCYVARRKTLTEIVEEEVGHKVNYGRPADNHIYFTAKYPGLSERGEIFEFVLSCYIMTDKNDPFKDLCAVYVLSLS